MTLLENEPPQAAAPPASAPRGGTGFYKPKGWGFFNLGPVGSAILAAAGFLVILTVLTPYTLLLSVIIIVLTAAGLAAASIPDKHGKTLVQRRNARRAFRKAKRRGTNLYTPGGLTDMGTHRLPGVLAATTLSEWRTDDDHPFAVVNFPTSHYYAITAGAQPDGASLLDPTEVNQQVANYGDWLASLAQEPEFVQGIVTIETAPTSGPLMQRTIRGQESERAHDLSKLVMSQVLEQYPQGSQGVDVTVTATFKAPPPEIGMDGKKIPRSERVDEAQMVGDLLRIRAPHLFADLPECGAGAIELMGADDLIERVRVAYNPGERVAYDEARARGQQRPITLWSSAGPAGAQEHWNWYQHGGGASITWEFTGFTSKLIQPDGLLPLLETGARSSTRISIIYQPIDPNRASAIVERNHNAAAGRVRDATKPTAQQVKVVRDADRARHSEADGHALLDFTILVTKTVLDPDELPRARAAIERLGPNARLKLRSMDGLQAPAFAQGLGVLGLVTDRHLQLPRGLMNGV